MRKIIGLLLPLFSLTSGAQRLGVNTGLAFSAYHAESNQPFNPAAPRSLIRTTAKPGWVIGGQVDLGLGQSLQLRTGVEMVVKGGREEGVYTAQGIATPYHESKNFVAFDVPILLLHQQNKGNKAGWLAGAGLVPGLLVEGGLNKFDLGAGVLLGYLFSSRIGLNAFYVHGLANVATHSFDYSRLQNRSFGLTASYTFRERSEEQRQALDALAEQRRLQKRTSTVLYLELGGSSGLASLNYDTRFTQSYKGLGLRLGAGLISDLSTSSGPVASAALNHLTGKRSHFLELATGATFFHYTEKNQDSWVQFGQESLVAPFVWAGYRYQPLEQRFVFRAGFCQFFTPVTMPGFLKAPVPSLSFGYRLQ